MKLVKYKYFFSWQFEERERWINEMSDNGWQLERMGEFKCTFTQSEPGEYIYRFQFLENSLKSDEKEYIKFVESTGAELVYRASGMACFRKKAADGAFELLSDTATRIKLLRKPMLYTGLMCLTNSYLAYSYFFHEYYVLAPIIRYIIGVTLLIAGVSGIVTLIVMLKKLLQLRRQHNLYE